MLSDEEEIVEVRSRGCSSPGVETSFEPNSESSMRDSTLIKSRRQVQQGDSEEDRPAHFKLLVLIFLPLVLLNSDWLLAQTSVPHNRAHRPAPNDPLILWLLQLVFALFPAWEVPEGTPSRLESRYNRRSRDVCAPTAAHAGW